MQAALALTTLAVLLLPAAGGAAEPLGPDEAEFCKLEVEALERRARLFVGQGLPPGEVRRRNAPFEQHLLDCRGRWREELRARGEEQRLAQEIARRAGADANELQRAQVSREVRLEHARRKRPAERTAAERQLVAEAEAEASARRAAEAQARDPLLQRRLRSALQCAHARRRDRWRGEIAEEERLSTMGGGDRQRLYFLRAELRRDEEVLARNDPDLALVGGPLPCSDPHVAPLAHCIEMQAAGREDPACETESMRAGLRLLLGP